MTQAVLPDDEGPLDTTLFAGQLAGFASGREPEFSKVCSDVGSVSATR